MPDEAGIYKYKAISIKKQKVACRFGAARVSRCFNDGFCIGKEMF